MRLSLPEFGGERGRVLAAALRVAPHPDASVLVLCATNREREGLLVWCEQQEVGKRRHGRDDRLILESGAQLWFLTVHDVEEQGRHRGVVFLETYVLPGAAESIVRSWAQTRLL